MMRKGCLRVLLNTCWVYHNWMNMLNYVLCYMNLLMLALGNSQLKYLLLVALLMKTT